MFGKLNGQARNHIDVSLDRLKDIIERAQEVEDTSSVSEQAPGRDSAARDFRRVINTLSADEQTVLVTLAWIGRGDYRPEEFDAALTAAFDRGDPPVADYLLELPRLASALETGALACGADLSDGEPGSHRPNGAVH